MTAKSARTGDPNSHPPLWRILALSLLVAYATADLLLAAGEMGGASADFFPQWVLARLAATGGRADSYDFATQAEFIRSLHMAPHWAELLKESHAKDIGVCPYPPTFCVVYFPLGRMPFETAAMVVYFVSIALAFVAAWAISDSFGGRLTGLPAAIAIPFYLPVQQGLVASGVSPGVMALVAVGIIALGALAFGGTTGRLAGFLTAAVCILFFPGMKMTLQLGQNSLLILVLWSLGWRELVRRRDLAAGLWWGLLGYKAPWLLAFGWVPLVIGRPRVLGGMAISAGLLVIAATALVGPESWVRWLDAVRKIDHVYVYDQEFRDNLLFMGGDLRSIFVRFVTDHTVGRFAGWAAIALVALVTAVWYRRRPAADPAGVEGPALLFASGLTVAHLYYYDETVFLLPLLVLWSPRPAPGRWRVAVLIGLTALYDGAAYVYAWARGIEQPPAWTAAVVLLWIFSLCMKDSAHGASGL
jgi:hypothetical protein